MEEEKEEATFNGGFVSGHRNRAKKGRQTQKEGALKFNLRYLRWSCAVGGSVCILRVPQPRKSRQVKRGILSIAVVIKGGEHSGSKSSAGEEVSSSSIDQLKGKMPRRRGTMYDRVVGHRKGFRVKGKGKVEEVKRRSRNDEREDGGREQGVDMDIRHRCALDIICALNDQLLDIQKEAVRGMVLSSVVESESKCFKLGRREVLFSHFDVALLMGFPATRKRIAFERSDGGSGVDEVLNGAMEEHVCRERQRQRTAQKDVRIDRNYVSVLLELCRVSNTVETLAFFKKLYTFLVVGGLLFPQCAGGVAWDLVHIVENVDGVGEYNWSEAV
ncbi:hypothetical protein Cgig2_012042 [Carnegiea gigantea]|uniref:Uncharacterized protein n=1 Tax=Carnegiea gigantea TaxID=171969 RepID=A0A9Q1KR72_9CARY|nr:hypothetical protein Cgig2_012042 [Carnegiea gigantea]